MEIMADGSLERLEAGVDRLLEAFSTLKAENRELREKLAGVESRQALFRDRLDSLISRIEGVAGQ
jgi:predicted nuclease with TOPRIM domain